MLSETVEPNGIAPGCHVTVACPSAETTAPASAGCATAEPGTAAGTGAATTGAVVVAVAEVEPPLPVAVTTSEIVEPMSPGVSVYVDASRRGSRRTAHRSRRSAATGRRRRSARRSRCRPTLVSVWPACAVPVTVGVDVATGRVDRAAAGDDGDASRGELAIAVPAQRLRGDGER